MKFSFCIKFSLLTVAVYAHGICQSAYSDTVHLDLSTAEQRLIARNLVLAAQKFVIGEHNAAARQAGLWDNPTLSFEQNIYNQETGKYFPTDENGQIAFEIQQPFEISGKRGRRVDIETISAEIAEHDFYDLLRTLRHELRTSFYELFYSQQLLAIYDREIEQMRSTVQLFQTQYERGNVSQKELFRLKAFLLSMENERKEINGRIIDDMSDVSQLTGDSTYPYLVPLVDPKTVNAVASPAVPLSALVDTAFEHRQDLKTSEASVRLEEQNLSLQKALVVPDVKLGFMYDRNASYIPDYKALTLEIDLPLFDRNQGSIEAAEYRVEWSKKQFEQLKLNVVNDVRKAFIRAQENDRLYRNFDIQFASDFDSLIVGIVRNYEKGNMSVLEFIDFFESYRNTMVQYYQLQEERMNAFEELNFATGTMLSGE